jgi:hypothetical protein
MPAYFVVRALLLCLNKYYGFGRSFWLGAASKAVVVEADAFKESDVIYKALNSRGHHADMLQTAELVSFYLNKNTFMQCYYGQCMI